MNETNKKKLLIALGDYGAGKTTFAKWYASHQQGQYIGYDLLARASDPPQQYQVFLDRLQAMINNSSRQLIVMDGYQGLSLEHLKEKLNLDIQLCLCFAAPHIMRQRQASKSPITREPFPHSEDKIRVTTRHLYYFVAKSKDPLLVDTTNGFEFVPMAKWPSRWQDLCFMSALDKMPHDKYYQDIELPSGLVIRGYSQSDLTWQRIRSVIDFKDKTILDIGCFHGFFVFKAEQAGAKSCKGIDINGDAIAVANQIAWLKGSKTIFERGDIANLSDTNRYDIILALNMLHHVTNLQEALANIFRLGSTVVLEIPIKQKPEIMSYAAIQGFQLGVKLNSHRDNREILVLTQPNSTVRVSKDVKPQYRYNYNWAKIKKIIRNIFAFPVRPLVHFYRRWRSRYYNHI